jgi:hypothetical protein
LLPTETELPKSRLSLIAMAEEADLSLEEAIAQVVARMVKLAHDLARTKVHEDQDWFRNMLVGILISTYQNYQAVLAGVPQTPTLACWGARNLLELRVITAYVLRSLDNAVDFMDDLAADTREFWENVGKMGRFTHNELISEMRATAMREDEPLKSLLLRKAAEDEQAGPKLHEPESELAKATKMMTAFGVDPTRKPKQGFAIAREVEQSDRYGPRYKVLSKVVHPTSLSIAAQTSTGSLDELMPLTNNQATGDMLAIFYAIEEHIAAHGISWPI